MDRYKFRGIPTKATTFGTDFVHGDLILRGIHAYILPKVTICSWSPEGKLTTTPIEVHQDTVGQYTGRNATDKREVFEGDIVEQWNGNQYDNSGEVVFKDAKFQVKFGPIKYWSLSTSCKVIGTIHDNKTN